MSKNSFDTNMFHNDYTDEDEDYITECDSDELCKNRGCDMGECNICGGNTSGGGCLRMGCIRDCSMEYEECNCDCLNCGSNSDEYLWCYCGDKKHRVSDARAIRRATLINKVPYCTNMSTAYAFLDAIKSLKTKKLTVKSLQDN